MTKTVCIAALAIMALLAGSPASAQPLDLPIVPATTDVYPPGVRVLRTAEGPVYADSRGRVLYGMDMRTLLRWGADPSKYCKDVCAETWEPVLPPAGAKVNVAYPGGFSASPLAGEAGRRAGTQPLPPGFVNPQSAPDWSVIEGPQGPQWVYKGWHMVYVRRGAAAAGDTSFDGTEGRSWNTLKFIPPKPVITAPNGIITVLHDGAWALADKDGRLLYTVKCQQDCAAWQPLAAGLASRGLALWSVSTAGERAQWLYRGQPVFVTQDAEEQAMPQHGKVLRP